MRIDIKIYVVTVLVYVIEEEIKSCRISIKKLTV